MIPGINLFAIATSAILTQEIVWRRFLGNVENPLGQLVPAFDDPVTIQGSIQAMDAKDVQRLGLDMREKHSVLYTSHDIAGIAKDGRQPDQIFYGDDSYDVIGETDWMKQDGWKGLVLIKK